MTLPKLTLVLGGAASGKSLFAETLVKKGGSRPTYIATAQVYDDEMAKKVAKHRGTRGASWLTIEEPLNIAASLQGAPCNEPVLIDCATLWLSNIILGDHDLESHRDALFAAIRSCPTPVVIVSNEVGQGIVPDNALSRTFRNAQGALNQQIAQEADLVVVVMAGLPMSLKGTLP